MSEGSVRARALAAALEPVVGSVYFSPEAHDAYHALGFGASPGRVTGNEWAESHWGRVMLPDGVAYFASRGAILGQVRGEVVAAAFGVFNPEIVVPAIGVAWSIAPADTLVGARTKGAVAQLIRILGPVPDRIEQVADVLARGVAPLRTTGRPMFAGLSALPMPTDVIGRMWRLGDMIREFRGDAHIAMAAAAGFDGCDLQVLTERCAGMPPRSYAAGHGWDTTQLAASELRLQRLGLLDGDVPTTHGYDAREALESETDRMCLPTVEAIGEDIAWLVGRLQQWSSEIRAADGYYPSSPQEAVLTPAVQQWMVYHGLPPFSGARSTT